MKSLFTESAVTLPSRAGRSRAGLQLPLSQAKTQESTSSHLPSDRHCCDMGMGVSMGAAPQRQLRDWTGVLHHVQHVHIRHRLCMIRKM